MLKKYVIIGKTGQLARALAREGKAKGYQITSLDREALDLTSPSATIEAIIAALSPEHHGLILAAAYTSVDAAETNTDLAFEVNSRAPGHIAKACAKYDIPMVHISTDYVFDGKASRPYTPDDETNPLGIYGSSKLNGEAAVLRSGARALVLRTSWVYDGTGSNFLTTMLKLSKTRDTISVVNDQFGRPTYAGHLAKAVFAAAEKLCGDQDLDLGVHHVTNNGDQTNWAEFAQAIFKANKSETHVNEIPSSEYPTPAKRPAYSVLSTRSFENVFQYSLPDWKIGLSEALEEHHAAQQSE